MTCFQSNNLCTGSVHARHLCTNFVKNCACFGVMRWISARPAMILSFRDGVLSTSTRRYNASMNSADIDTYGRITDTIDMFKLAGMDNNLFVSKYQLELPRKEEIQRFLEEKMREVGNGEGSHAV